MAKKSLGYVRAEWTCPNCQTRNPGPQKTCTSCGMPQPDDVKFEQTAQEQLITDEAELQKAKAGPDIHCYYCGTRNAAGAATCTQCGADLTEGAARKKGEVMGAHRDKPAPKITCEACGTENEANAGKCVQCGSPLAKPEPTPKPKPDGSLGAKAAAVPGKRVGLFGGIALGLLVLCCVAAIAFFVLSSRTSDLNGTVSDVSWTRTIAIEALQPVEHETWKSDIPAEAIMGACNDKVHHTQDTPTDNSKEVCGTPYSVDQGSGYAEIVQDCRYEVYQAWCKYTVDEWQKANEVVARGSDFNPTWPSVGALGRGQREGNRSEDYRVNFNTENGQYDYQPNTLDEFKQYELGSRWILKINTFGVVNETAPLR